jgi:hypothetical protein
MVTYPALLLTKEWLYTKRVVAMDLFSWTPLSLSRSVLSWGSGLDRKAQRPFQDSAAAPASALPWGLGSPGGSTSVQCMVLFLLSQRSTGP